MRECDLPKELATLIGCDYSAVTGQRDDKLLRSMLKRAHKMGAENGFATVIIECSEDNFAWLRERAELKRNTPEYRQRILHQTSDGKQVLDTLISERKLDRGFETAVSFEPSVENAISPLIECFHLDGTPKDVMLAYIPTKKPYEALSWLPPFTDIVSEGEMLAIMRWWYECYGAVPTMVGCNYIELSARKLSYDEALWVATEQYALAPNIVDEGVGSISALADTLMRSDTWLLWW